MYHPSSKQILYLLNIDGHCDRSLVDCVDQNTQNSIPPEPYNIMGEVTLKHILYKELQNTVSALKKMLWMLQEG